MANSNQPAGGPNVYDDQAQGVEVDSVTVTATSATVSVASGGFPGVSNGMVVSGAGIPLGTTVVSGSGNNRTLSNQATANGTVTLIFAPTTEGEVVDTSDVGTTGTIGTYLPGEQTDSESYTYPEPLGHEPYPHWVSSRTYNTTGLPGDDGFNWQNSQEFVTY